MEFYQTSKSKSTIFCVILQIYSYTSGFILQIFVFFLKKMFQTTSGLRVKSENNPFPAIIQF